MYRTFAIWVATACGWLAAAALAYLGIALIALGGVMGPRGDIDYPDFTPEKKAAADQDATITRWAGVIPLAASVLLLVYSKRSARWVFRERAR